MSVPTLALVLVVKNLLQKQEKYETWICLSHGLTDRTEACYHTCTHPSLRKRVQFYIFNGTISSSVLKDVHIDKPYPFYATPRELMGNNNSNTIVATINQRQKIDFIPSKYSQATERYFFQYFC